MQPTPDSPSAGLVIQKKRHLICGPGWAGLFRCERPGSTIDVIVRNGQMFHRISERGLSAEYAVAYQIGSGKAGHGYIVQQGEYLIQSPAAWYNPQRWDVAPGFVSSRLLDFDRGMIETCLYCHAGESRFSEEGRRFVGAKLT